MVPLVIQKIYFQLSVSLLSSFWCFSIVVFCYGVCEGDVKKTAKVSRIFLCL